MMYRIKSFVVDERWEVVYLDAEDFESIHRQPIVGWAIESGGAECGDRVVALYMDEDVASLMTVDDEVFDFIGIVPKGGDPDDSLLLRTRKKIVAKQMRERGAA